MASPTSNTALTHGEATAGMEVVVSAHGGPEVLKVQPCSLNADNTTHTLRADEILVRNTYAGVNYIDTYFRSGIYPSETLPFVCGIEGSGTVIQCGAECPPDLVGHRVVYFGGTVTGSYATYTIVKAASVHAIPDEIDDATATAVMCQGLTAHYLVNDSYPCKPGSVVVVHAAAGGTGLLVCQLAKNAGATVVGICGGPEKVALATSVGRADHVIDYAAISNWPHAVRAMFPEGVDAVYDGVGRSTFEGSLSLLKKHGYMISFGNASGVVGPITPQQLMRAGSVYLQRPSLSDYIATEDEAAQRVAEVFAAVQSKALTVTIGTVFPLTEAEAAHRALQGRQTSGKILLDCRGGDVIQ